jgi:hypothetical protein
MTALLVMTDGRRDCIARTIPTALEHLSGPITARVIHDDSADPAYRAWLAKQFPNFEVIGRSQRLGFGGAIQNAWRHLRSLQPQFVFHLEDDFLLRRPVDLEAMTRALHCEPHLVQMALLRQAVNDAEKAAGGVVEQNPDAYTTVTREFGTWREHRRFFTTNPSLYRGSLCRRPWPDGDHSEGRFGWDLFAEDPDAKCAFWGEGEWVEHIGDVRAGTGY